MTGWPARDGVAPGPDFAEQGDAAGGDASDAALVLDAGPTDSGIRRDAEAGSNGCQVRRAGSSRPARSAAPPAAVHRTRPASRARIAPPVWPASVTPRRRSAGPIVVVRARQRTGPHPDSGGSRCEAGHYCAERPLRDDADSAGPLRVPVCVTAEKCLLSEPYPCPPNGACTCPDGTACTIVRNDGTTGCVEPPGSGVQGEACPCAAGHLCTSATNRCLKLCLTTALEPDCPTPLCQNLAGLPPDWGVCVGPMDAGNSR